MQKVGPEVRHFARLTPLTTVGFRVAVTIAKSPMGPWSQVVNILAL